MEDFSAMERAVEATRDLTAWIPEEAELDPECKVVIVDTETTGFGAQAELVQIAARCGQEVFEVFMLPTVAIGYMASVKTGFTVSNKKLFYHNKEMKTVPSEEAARDFLSFLHGLGRQVVLVGHNLIRFDMPILMRWLNAHGAARELCEVMYGMTCTLPLLKQGKVQKQDLLAKQYLTGPEWHGVHEGAHNAATDCLLLEGLLKHFGVSESTLKENCKTTRAFLQDQAKKQKIKDNLPKLSGLVAVVSKGMLEKMAAAGITEEALKLEFRSHGRKGVEVALSVRVNGKPRVTSSKKILSAVCDYVERLFIEL